MNALQKEWELLQVLQSRVELGGDFSIRYQPKLCRVSETDQLVLLSKFQKLGVLDDNFPQIGKPTRITAEWWALKINQKSFESHYARIRGEYERYALAYEDRKKSIALARATRAAEPIPRISASRSQHPLVDKLDDFNHRVQLVNEGGTFTRITVEIIGIEFFDFVQSQQALRDEFDRRASYFGNLVEDSAYLAVDKRLRQPITDLCILFKGVGGRSLLEKVQSRFSTRLINRLTEGDKDYLTLPECVSILCSGKGLNRLGDQTPTSFGKAFNRSGSVERIRSQARMIGVILQKILENLPEDSGAEESISDIQNRFSVAQSEMEGLLYVDPVRLHAKEFQQIFQIACQAVERRGEEFVYQILCEKNLDPQRTRVDFATVVKELIFHLRVKEVDQKQKGTDSGINFHEVGKFLRIQSAGRVAQFPLSEQQTHILRFCLMEKQRRSHEKEMAITYKEAWAAVVDADDTYSLKLPGQDKANREIRKSVTRHLEAIEKKLHEKLAIPSSVQIFKRVPRGFMLML